MGSLSLTRGVSRPLVQPAPGYTPIPVVTSVPAAPVNAAIDNGTNDAPKDVNAARVNAILQSRRGLSGTIATSWRGLLNNTAPAQNGQLARKTLLGE